MREPQPDPSPTEDLGGQQTYPKSVPTLLCERMVRLYELGSFLGVLGLLIFHYSLTSANMTGWSSGQIIGSLEAGIVLLALFLLHEQRGTVPLMPSWLSHNRSCNLTLVLAANIYAV